MPESRDVSMEELKTMADLAGLGMDDQELEELKPIYDLYAEYARQLHTIDYRGHGDGRGVSTRLAGELEPIR